MNPPSVLASAQINRVERAPRRSNGGIAFGVQKSAISQESVFHSQEFGSDTAELLALAVSQEIDELDQWFSGQIRKPRHSALSRFDRRGDLIGR